MDRKKSFGQWCPDPTVAELIRPHYDRGYTASTASTLLIRDKDGNIVKNPNIKTYFKYWRFWKEEDNGRILLFAMKSMKKRQKILEKYWLPFYDELILIAHEMEQTLEKKLFPNGIVLDFSNNRTCRYSLNDLPLHKMFSKIIMLQFNILQSKYNAENNLVIFNFKFNHFRNL